MYQKNWQDRPSQEWEGKSSKGATGKSILSFP